MTTIPAGIGDHDPAITREGYERLGEELTALTTISRAEISDRLRAAHAQGGELADNSDLIDSLEDQEFLERRITILAAALNSARVVDDPPRDGKAGVGTRVRLRDIDTGRMTEYRIVGSIEADPAQRKLSAESPVGRALLGRRAGDVIDVEAPRGTMRFQIVAVLAEARMARRPSAVTRGARRAASTGFGRAAVASAR